MDSAFDPIFVRNHPVDGYRIVAHDSDYLGDSDHFSPIEHVASHCTIHLCRCDDYSDLFQSLGLEYTHHCGALED